MIARNEFPYFLNQVIDELKQEDAITSIWFIGSRANGKATEASDWDLLVFSTIEPSVIEPRHENVDVIIVGPSKKFLLEGKSIYYKSPFNNFHWSDKGNGLATYIGMKFIDYPGTRDSSEPICERTTSSAYCLWNKVEVNA